MRCGEKISLYWRVISGLDAREGRVQVAPGSAVDAPQIEVAPGAEGWALSWTLCNRPPSFRSKAEEFV